MQSIWLCGEKGHPIQFALNGTRGATGKHLRANDLIKASQASPLTHSIKAICWLLNKRIIFLPWLLCARLCAVLLLDPGRRLPLQHVRLLSVSWLWEHVIWAVLFLAFHMCMGCMCSSSGQTRRTSQAFTCCVSGNDVGMRLPLQAKEWKHIKGIVHFSRYNPNSLTWFRDTIRKEEGGIKALLSFSL